MVNVKNNFSKRTKNAKRGVKNMHGYFSQRFLDVNFSVSLFKIYNMNCFFCKEICFKNRKLLVKSRLFNSLI
jgi:hypothetical protein